MRDMILRLAVVFALFFSCLGVLEESVYLSIAVFKIPLLAIAPFALLIAFLVFVGKPSRRNIAPSSE